MNGNRLWALIGRKLAGEATAQELDELEILSKDSPDASIYTEILTTWWNIAERSGKEEAEKVFHTMLREMEMKSETKGYGHLIAINGKRLIARNSSNHHHALINPFKIAKCNFRKNRTISFVNLIGFAIGLVVCLLIAMYVAAKLTGNFPPR